MKIPGPKYKIGDVVWLAGTERTIEMLPCPDCKGEKVWHVTSPAGESFTCACPRCQTSYSFRDNLPSLTVERAKPTTEKRVITGISVDADHSEFRPAVEYRSSISNCSYRTMKESEMYDSEDAALQVAKLKAADLNTKMDGTPEVLNARHFSTLPMKEGQFDRHRNGLWEAHYHAGNLMQRVKEALHGENDDVDNTEKQVIESLEEAVRWDFGYHIDHMPLKAFFEAASASTDDAVRAQFESLPEGMKDLFGMKVEVAPAL